MPKRSNGFIGLMGAILAAVILFFGFTKDIPFTHGFQIKAQFESANSIRPNSPVRIAGVEVGKVKSVTGVEGSNAALITMELKDTALPIHEDATAKVRPRIFLEGNFFVDLKPGTPGAPVLKSGDTIKITQTASPVQLDEVLTSLQSDSREDLQRLLVGLDASLNSKPTPAQNADASPLARGQTGAESFNDALDDIPEAERSTAQVLEALLGTEPGRDVERLIKGTANTAEALDRSEGALKDLITNLNLTTATFASESANLRATIRELPPTLATANAAFTSLNAAFPPTREFARAIRPGVRETPATIAAAFPWIEQAHALVGKPELGGLAEELSPATQDLARLIDRATELLPQTDLASKCLRDVVLPAGDQVINDEFATGSENYKEFFYALVGIAGEGQNTDGNGMYVRFQTGGGTQSVSLGSKTASTGQLFGNNVAVPLGNRPAYPGKLPPYKPDAPCYKQKIPDVNGPAAAKSLPTGAPAETAQVKSAREKLLREADLSAVRRKLHPFGTAKKGSLPPSQEKAK
ncbi:MCE family protein [Solirubrobacter ginsenosidimutans]|uniref:MCE family protein n=1 Tax=Solirubrobacter ginsenosidimutans TaxID=490573 RepID=A0A9X3MUW2_9ACTN|nr:MlaD family protein [Solirubrobacter ginsenosidimutans]MDA0162807.1 MCE family protein [Solirubrobacter ginsenosidimutans]